MAQEARKLGLSAFRQSHDPKHFIGPIDPSALDVYFRTPDLGETLCVRELGLPGPQPLFDQPAFCQIDAGANKSDELAVSVTRHAGVQDPTIFSVGAPQPELYLESAAAVERR